MCIRDRDQAQRVIDDVLKLSVPNEAGEMVPFSSFTKVEEQLGPVSYTHLDVYKRQRLCHCKTALIMPACKSD